MTIPTERELPAVEALAGSAEAIPLPDASVDGVTVGEAFHWFETEVALAETHRVLRSHGGLATTCCGRGTCAPRRRAGDDRSQVRRLATVHGDAVTI